MNMDNSSSERSAPETSPESAPHSQRSRDGRAEPVIVVLSADADLRELLGRVNPATAGVQFADDWPALLKALQSQRRPIVVLDADGMEVSQFDARLDELGRLPVPPVIISAAAGERAKESMERLHLGKLHRLLLKPATPGAVRLAVDYAVGRSRQGRSTASAPTPARSQPRGVLLAIGAAVVVVVAVLALVFLRGPGESPVEAPALVQTQPAPTPAPAPALSEPPALPETAAASPQASAEPADSQTADAQTADAQGIDPETSDSPPVEEPAVVEPAAPAAAELDSVLDAPEPALAEAPSAPPVEAAPAVAAQPREIDRLLQQGDARLQAGALIEPEADSAFAYYQRASAIDAADPQLVALRARLREAVFGALRQALDLGELAEVESLLQAGATLGINAEILDNFAAQAEALSAQGQAARAAELLSLGLERVREQRFFAPEGDSAAVHLGRLRAESPNHPGLAQLLSTLAEEAGQATARGDLDPAGDLIELLRQIGADAGLTEPLALSLASARRQDEFLRVPARSTDLRLLRAEPAAYPPVAMRRGLEGWVDVDFIVDRDGVPRNIEVTGSEPAGIFDRAALNAVGTYRYEPFSHEGNVYERRVELRLVFELN